MKIRIFYDGGTKKFTVQTRDFFIWCDRGYSFDSFEEAMEHLQVIKDRYMDQWRANHLSCSYYEETVKGLKSIPDWGQGKSPREVTGNTEWPVGTNGRLIKRNPLVLETYSLSSLRLR